MTIFKTNKNSKKEFEPNVDWDFLIDHFYCESNTLPDIIIENCNNSDWIKFINFTNNNYKVKFKLNEGYLISEKINFSEINRFWNGYSENGCMASVFIDQIQLNIFFNSQDVIDHDFDTNQINNLDDHNKLMNYLKEISHLLKKEISIYAEGTEEILLAKISKSKVTYHNR